MLHPLAEWTIPVQTIEVATAAFPKGNIYMKMSEQLGQIYQDEEFSPLYRFNCGQPAYSPARLALITIMQFAEGLSDRQAAEAVRSRIDWKYALGLELKDSGFDHTILREFRNRLIESNFERQLLDLMLAKFQSVKLIKSRGQQRTDSTHVEAAIRKLNRLELVGETLRHTLNELATFAPDWLITVVHNDWIDLYTTRFEQYRLPKEKAEQIKLALRIGADGHKLLTAYYQDKLLHQLQNIDSLEILRQVWLQQYTIDIKGELIWRDQTTAGLPPNRLLLQSPYDIEARNRTKRDTNWTGYALHITETCDDDSPNLITNVETTVATIADADMTEKIHESLARKQLLPQEHFVDTGFVDADNIVNSDFNYQLNLVGRVLTDTSWQKKANQGFDISCFKIDWDNKFVQCPMGTNSVAWRERTDDWGNPAIEVRFDRQKCAACQQRASCTHAKSEPRLLKLRHKLQHEALQKARETQQKDDFKIKYSKRAGIEATIGQATGKYLARRSRYIGKAKTHLQHIATAAAINLSRLWSWWNQTPKAQTRVTAWAKFCQTQFNSSF
jgi:transposase